jgi:hypothetical protein
MRHRPANKGSTSCSQITPLPKPILTVLVPLTGTIPWCGRDDDRDVAVVRQLDERGY